MKESFDRDFIEIQSGYMWTIFQNPIDYVLGHFQIPITLIASISFSVMQGI